MILMTQELREQFKSRPLYSTEENNNALSICKFFDPCGSFTWHAWEFDGEDTFFGFVTSSLCPEGEWGYFYLSELSNIRGSFGLGIERDLYYTPKRKSDM